MFLYIMLAYLMMSTALLNAVCLDNSYFFSFAIHFCIIYKIFLLSCFVLVLLTHGLFLSFINLHYVQCF